MFLGRLAVAGLLLAGVAIAGPAAPASAATPDVWLAAAGDAGNARTNPGETSLTTANAARVGTAWATATRSSSAYAPAVVDGVALRVTTDNGTSGNQLTSTSATTGATLGTVPLPGSANYSSGLVVSGSLVVIPFNGFHRPGGVLVVDRRTQSVLWSRDLPASTISWTDNSQAGTPYTDGQRVFVSGSSNQINAYRLSDGALLWTAPVTFDAQRTPNRVDGMAVGNGVVYTGGAEGLVAYDAATGRRLWSGPGGGLPVVAGGRVFVTGEGVVRALPAAGCGKSTCTPSWTASFPVLNPNSLAVSGADASSLFVTYSDAAGVITRLSASTGARQWSTTIGRFAVGLVRAGDMVWLNNEYVDAGGAIAQRIVGFSVAATGSAPLRTIPLPDNLAGFPQTLGVAAGTLFQQGNGKVLVGYRVAASTPVNAAPIASFTATVNGTSVLVDATGSRDPDGQVKTYAWDFGNGVTGVNDMSAVTYASPGTYRITLTVGDWSGATATTSQSVTVGAAGTAFAADTFRRTVSGGLGAADLGGSWTVLSGAGRQSVSGGTATLSLPAPGASVGAFLNGGAQAGADVTATVSLNATPDGGGASYYLIGRRTGANLEYRLKVRFAGDGTVRLTTTVLDSSASERFIGAETVVSGLRYTPGTPLHLRFRVAGSGTSQLQGRAWTGSMEPTGWTVSRTDTTASVQGRGQVGMSAYLSSSVTRLPLAFSITEFQARPAG